MLCNFVVCQGRMAKFGRLGYFHVYFSKNYLFLKLKASRGVQLIKPFRFSFSG